MQLPHFGWLQGSLFDQCVCRIPFRLCTHCRPASTGVTPRLQWTVHRRLTPFKCMASGSAAVLLFIIFLHCLAKYSTYQRGISSTKVRTLHQHAPPNSTDYICTDFLEVSDDIVLSPIHTFDCLNHKAKRAVCYFCRLSVSKTFSTMSCHKHQSYYSL